MQELARKLIHVIFGLAIAGMVLVLDHNSALAVLAGGLFFGLILIDLILRGYTLPVISAVLDYVDRCDPLTGKRCFIFRGECPYLCNPFPDRDSLYRHLSH